MFHTEDGKSIGRNEFLEHIMLHSMEPSLFSIYFFVLTLSQLDELLQLFN